MSYDPSVTHGSAGRGGVSHAHTRNMWREQGRLIAAYTTPLQEHDAKNTQASRWTTLSLSPTYPIHPNTLHTQVAAAVAGTPAARRPPPRRYVRFSSWSASPHNSPPPDIPNIRLKIHEYICDSLRIQLRAPNSS